MIRGKESDGTDFSAIWHRPEETRADCPLYPEGLKELLASIPAPAVMKGDRMVIGPGTDVPLDDFYRAGVPDKIVRYIFKDDVLWYGFETYGREHGRDDVSLFKSAIRAVTMKLNIRLNKVSLDLGSIKNEVNGPRGGDQVGLLRFNFTINNDKTRYTLTATNFTTINKLTINIDDENGQTLFNKTFNAS